jgi:hypothetical protein
MKPNIRALLDAVSHRAVDQAEQRSIMGQFGSTNWSDDTWKWRLGVLRSWLYATGQVRNRRAAGLVAI